MVTVVPASLLKVSFRFSLQHLLSPPPAFRFSGLKDVGHPFGSASKVYAEADKMVANSQEVPLHWNWKREVGVRIREWSASRSPFCFAFPSRSRAMIITETVNQ